MHIEPEDDVIEPPTVEQVTGAQRFDSTPNDEQDDPVLPQINVQGNL